MFRPGPLLRACLPLAALLLAAVAVAAPAVPDSALARTLDALPGEFLTLGEAVTLALHHDTGLMAARADLAAAAGAERQARGVFTPELFGRAERSGDDVPSASFFAGADVLRQEQTLLSGGARMTLPTGTQLSASLNTTRLTTNNAFASLSPQIDTFGRLEVVQPLLQGFGNGTRGEAQAASSLREGAEAALAEADLATRAETELTYWSLYAAERDFAVQSLIRDRARAFLQDARLRADAGLAGPADVASAEVFLAQQEQAVLDSEEMLDTLSDALAVLLDRRPAGGAPRYRPADTPPTPSAPAPLEALVTGALERSPRVLAARSRVDAARARVGAARVNSRPRLDLFGSLGGRGLSGTGRDVVVNFGEGEPDTIRNVTDTGYGDGFSQVLERRYPTWSVGVEFALPLGGNAADGTRAVRDAELARAEHQLEALTRAVEQDVRLQFRDLERGRERLALAERGVDASLEQARIGQLEFRSGRVTAFELVRLSADLADAQRRYSAALVRAARAAANLRRLTGGAFPGGTVPAGNPENTP
ncbi:MAG TPA: TolC family protein [Candidatus Krumholzibacteria bacterium]|nr:TolC family protein [Candidatus Krumholzibacteria bacterium]